MEIVETNLKFGSLSDRSSTRRIILHNADARTCSAEDIHRWHRENGWSGAGYHFLVRKSGKVYRLRPEKAVGAHAAGANSDSIGICFEGAFNKETMGDAQVKAGQELIAYLLGKYGNLAILRHKDVGDTDCPGKNFPFDRFKNVRAAASKTAAKTATAATAFKSYKVKVTATSGLNIRKAAGTANAVVTAAPKGSKMTVSAEKSVGGVKWGKVSYRKKTGWCVLKYTVKV